MRTAERPRRMPQKSRTGCQNCKTRKIKCGEELPTCLHCARRGDVCDLATRTAQQSASSSRGSDERSISSPLTVTSSTTAASILDSSTESLPLNILDLELLHHYNTSTYSTLSSDPAMRNYFLESVPRLGFSHPYVLHALLALSASHVAHFRPESRGHYHACAKVHHGKATTVAAPLLMNITEEERIPMYFFSIFTLFISFASLRDEGYPSFDGDDVIPAWFSLFRGVRTILASGNGAIYRSSLAFFFTHSRVNDTWFQVQLDFEPILDFQRHLASIRSESAQNQQLLVDTFEDLRRALYFFYVEELGDGARVRSMFTWMYRVTDDFVALLQAKNQDALSILAFACVLLHQLDYKWWMQGWGTHLLGRIYAALDEVHRFWIRWPIQQIGWIPPR
ncbi:hypothetical protein CSIM01_13338 [Colletotrichum simmondsii]|uniref:Zn(2)-C6 fungal-type domain-containing protein n=1 Tax=Colletotrichum simmondsii TaxID=703756 RepID=A0A135RZ36_9PEZI|nr:hypothetical protein CSIM01_13338 [Colletotrichum simmondsii]